MITFLDGTLVEKQPTRVVMNVGGVGYELLIPLSSYAQLPDENASCRILAYDHVREDAHELFGFVTEDERAMFRLLIGVSGIGPKTAMSALSGMSVRELKAAIVENDVKRLSSISGIGKKTAERLVVELKDKFTAGEALEAISSVKDLKPGDMKLRDAALALISLGYKQADAQTMIKTSAAALEKNASVEEILRKALAK